MIPLKLTIEGMYSYQSPQVIDFKTLTESKVFGIFGGVGSGKSSLLEAITFALYNKTERLSERSARNYNMMNLKSDRLLIDFEFLSDEGIAYRFVVRGKRSKKRFEDVQTFNRAAYKKSKGEWIPLEKNTAEDILGLSYDNFRRTVIIPQGKFREFLELKPTARRKMLLELFGLDSFDLYDATSQLFFASKTKMEHLNGQLLSLETYSDEARTTIEERMKSSTVELEKTDRELLKARETYTRLQQLAQAASERQKLQAQWAHILAQKDEMEALSRQLELKLYAIRHFKADLQSLRQREENLQSLQTKYNEICTRISETKKALELARKQLEHWAEKYEHRAEKSAQLRDLDLLIAVKKEEEKAALLRRRLTTGTQKLEDQKSKVTALEQQRLKLRKSILAKENLIPQSLQINKLREKQVLRQSLIQRIEEEEHSREKIQLELSQLDAQLEKVFLDLPPSIDKTHLWNESWEKELKLQLDALQMQRSEIQKERQKYRFRSGLQDFADALKPGEPCVLCGSVDHPSPMEFEGIEETISYLDKKLEAVETQQKTLDRLQGQLFRHHVQSKDKQEQIASLTNKLASLRQELNEANEIDALQISGYDSYKNAETLLTAIEADQEALEQLKEELRRSEAEFEAEREKLELFHKHFQDIEQQLSGILSGMEALEKQWTTRPETRLFDMDVRQLSEYQSKAQAQLQHLISMYEQTEKTVQKTSTQCSVLEARKSEASMAIEEEKAAIIKISRTLDHTLQESPITSLGEVQQILDSTLDIDISNQKLREYRENMQSVRTQLSVLDAQLDAQEISEDALTSASEKLQEIEAKNKRLRDEIGGLKQQLKDFRDKLKLKKELIQKRDKLSLRLDNLRLLLQMFKGAGFVDFVSTVHLRQLCITANKRFQRLTRHRLSLELKSDNSFQIRDHLNEGRLRSVNTLSGGQMFQLSLSLALALADSIRQYRGNPQNFFFLDEGFGTLDGESLRLVFDTLKDLRKEERIVGVISHVEALREEVDVAVFVENDERSGSRVNLVIGRE